MIGGTAASLKKDISIVQDITGLTVLAVANSYAIDVHLTSSNAAETINNITGTKKCRLLPENDLVLTVTIGGRGPVLLNGSVGDNAVMEYNDELASWLMQTPEQY